VNVIIANRQRMKKINLRLLRQITNALLVELKIENAELGINLIGTAEMTSLNEKFLRHTGSTDVITFDYLKPEARSRKPELQLHGEFFVCVDDAVSQAKQFKTKWQSEIVRYIVHAILHLLGHDDLRVEARRKMKREEKRLLHKLSKNFSLAQIERRSKISA
jgi:probable rRNA maturation factor